jgi:hypothetical protein
VRLLVRSTTYPSAGIAHLRAFRPPIRVRLGPSGYGPNMTTSHPEDRPFDVEGVPAEEDISTADAVDRLDEDPEEQKNFPEQKEIEEQEHRPS